MNRLYDEEMGDNATNGDVVSFSSATISKGLIEFCKRFDYESLQPSKISDKNNYYNWLNKVLLIKNHILLFLNYAMFLILKQQRLERIFPN